MRRFRMPSLLVAPMLGAMLAPSAALAQSKENVEAGFERILDGRSLDGWVGQDSSFWSVEDGAITGTITPDHAPAMNQYLVWRTELVDDFELKLDFRLTGSTTPNINGGFQFRSRRLPNGDVAGYQVDNNFGQPWKVRLYDEFGRHNLAVQGERSVFGSDGSKQVEPLSLAPGAGNFQLDQWHEYHLIARGPHLKLKINGHLVAESTDNDPQQQEALGVLAMQLHTGPPMKAQFRDVRIKRLQPEQPASPRERLMATAALDWRLGERATAHQPPLAAKGSIASNLAAEGPAAQSEAKVARLENAYFDGGNAWNAPGEAITVYLRARMSGGNWTQPLFSKGSDPDDLNFRLFSEDLVSTPGPDIGFDIRTGRRSYRVSFPVSLVAATAWHDLVGRYDGKNLELICDGQVMVRVNARGALSENDSPVLIGAEADSGGHLRTMDGELQVAAVWTRALSDDELAVLCPAARGDDGACTGGDVSAVSPPSAPTLPRIAPTEPSDAEQTFRVLDGFRMELIAAEPLVTDPVAIAYDENGRAYVVEMNDYPYTDKSNEKPFVERTTDEPLGRVRLLEDTDGDGRFDHSTVFAKRLSWPTGVAVWRGGVFVAATPDVWYLKDTDGDGRSDVRRKVFSGFRKFNVQAVMNNLKWGLDHRIYGAGASNGGTIRGTKRPNEKPLALARQDFRFDPRDESIELLSGGARFGNAFDDWGNRFICNIRNPVQHVVLQRRYLARNPFLPVASAVHDAALAGDTLQVFRASPTEPWRAMRAERWAVETGQIYPRSETVADGYFTSSSGVTVYRGDAYPSRYRGNIFVGEVAGNLVHRQTLAPDGATFVARRADQQADFVASTDNWFRPVNYVNAPDGTLHVLDMYRETIEHPWSIPDDIKALVDLESGRDRGRIYRLAPPDFAPRPIAKLGEATMADLVHALESANCWQRDTAHRLLFERQDQSAVPPLRALLRRGNVKVARLHALWSLAGLEALDDEDLLVALSDSTAPVREHAVRLAETRAETPAVVKRMLELADDADPRVRFQVALSLGAWSDERASDALFRIARRDASDPWTRAAILSSTTESVASLLELLLGDESFRRQTHAGAMLRDLGFVVGSRNRDDEVTVATDALAALPATTMRDLQSATLLGLGQGLRRRGKHLHSIAAEGSQTVVGAAFERADSVARDADAASDERLRAVELLGCGQFESVAPTLAALVEPQQSRPLQLAAVRALAGYRHADVPRLLLAGYRGLTPPVRAEIVQALLTRAERIEPLLAAIESRTVSAFDVPEVRRSLLLTHKDEAVRSRAAALFDPETPAARSAAVASYRPALSSAGDAKRGQAVLERECLVCHRLGNAGHDVGPNLLGVRRRAPDELLLHILDPNREVAPNFVDYIVVTADGRTTTGVIAAETATSITLRRAEGQQETILRDDIDAITSSGRSLMPEGLEQRITPQEMADLLARLLGRK